MSEGGKLCNTVYVDQSQPFAAGAPYSTTRDLLLARIKLTQPNGEDEINGGRCVVVEATQEIWLRRAAAYLIRSL